MIEVKDIKVGFEDKVVLNKVSATFETGKTNLIIGRSGAGKTVLLKSLIGIFTPQEGEIIFGKDIDLCKLSPKEIKKLRLHIGVLFQGSALLDSMTVLDNVLFPLDMFSYKPRIERVEKALYFIEQVGLEEAIYKYPAEISGGMMKRCALARALVNDPDYLFCDEPNSGLDPQTGAQIDELISKLTHQFGITTVINTHDMNSLRNIGEHIVYLHKGKVEWSGSYEEIEHSDNELLSTFVESAID